jgi:transcriptional regulator with XRE-family HTH domain
MDIKNRHPVEAYVGNKVREARTYNGLSQTKLGNMTGVTFQQIQKYEKGVNRIGSSRLYEFSQILRVPVSYFFEGLEDNIESEDAVDFDGRMTKLTTAFGKLPEYMKVSTLHFVQSMARSYVAIGEEEVEE